MPWQNQETYELTDQQVWKAPPKSGVYGLLRPETWLFIGLQGIFRRPCGNISAAKCHGSRNTPLVFRFRARSKTQAIER